MKQCITHHYACDCREEKFEALLEVLETVRELFKDGSSTQQMIDEAIAQAKGKS